MPPNTLRMRKGSAPLEEADPHHFQGRLSAKKNVQAQISAADSADQGVRTPVEVVEAALAAMLDAWPDISEAEKARILANLGVRRETVPPVLSLQRAAHLAGVSEQTVARWCERHEIGHRIGGRWAVDGGRLDAFLAGGAL